MGNSVWSGAEGFGLNLRFEVDGDLSDARNGFQSLVVDSLEDIYEKLENNTTEVAENLKERARLILSGARSGRIYPFGGSFYQASAVGESPAERTGKFRDSWEIRPEMEGNHEFSGKIISELSVGGYNLGTILENGTSKMGARPYQDKVVRQELAQAEKIYLKDLL